MNKKVLALITVVGWIQSTLVNAAPFGTAFTFQGRLNDSSAPATGLYDFNFRLHSGPGNTDAQVGSAISLNAVGVTNGLFNVKLDFGVNVFQGDARWLNTQVKTNSNLASYSELAPRQELTPQPYALYAAQSASAATAGSAESVPWSGVTGLTLGPGIVTTAGGFGVDPGFGEDRFWKLLGNGVTTPGMDFLGTTDNQPLILKTAGAEAMRVGVGGNVGIGTATPADKLHVAGSAIFQGPSPWIDVRHYGAKGDGVTDDTGALRDALNAVPAAGAVVFAPPGTYLINESLALRSGTTLRGAGTATVFKRTGPLANVFDSESVTNVTAEAFSIDMNGSDSGTNASSGSGIKLYLCSNVRIRDLRILDSTGTNICCRHGILVRGGNHVWIERNLLTDGLRIKAGGVGDKLVIAENMLEDPNDNGISIVQEGLAADTINYIIRNNVVKAARLESIAIGLDGPGTNTQVFQRIFQNIIVDGNLLIGPLQPNNAFIGVNLATKTERLHIINNILVNVGDVQPTTVGIYVTRQASHDLAGPGTDFLIANNSVDGAFGAAGIWVYTLRAVRIAHNQITYSGTNVIEQFAIRVGNYADPEGGVNEAVIQGNITRNFRAGLLIENSTKVLVHGNVFTDMVGYGIRLTSTRTNDQTSAQIMGNIISGTTSNRDNFGMPIEGQAIIETGLGMFDTQYLFNDLRKNVGGAFGYVNPAATRLGNLGTDEYIQRHISATNSLPWNPPNLANATSTSTTVSVSGASVGDTVAVGFSPAVPGGMLLTGAVTATDTVTVTLANLTGTSQDLAEGTLRADVWKH